MMINYQNFKQVPHLINKNLLSFWLVIVLGFVFFGCQVDGQNPTDTSVNTDTNSVAGVMGGESGSSSSGEMMNQDVDEPAGEEVDDTLPTMPIEGCIGPMNIEDIGANRAVSEAPECVTCEGSLAPQFALRDLSPTSCGVGKYYGLDAFQGQVTFVVLLRSTCGYCHGQLEQLERMRFELLAMGYSLHMVVINEFNTESTVNLLTQRAQIPILQDVSEVNGWLALSDLNVETNERQGGDKDDMYIYGVDGTLWRFLDDDDPTHQLNLSTDEGYLYLKETLIEALNAQ